MNTHAAWIVLLFCASCAQAPERTSESTDLSRGSERASSSEPARIVELPANLSDEAAKSFAVLANTDRFTDEAIGIGGVTPCEVVAVRRLLREPSAAEIFHQLFEVGSVATQLYALCGLYYSDPPAFQEGVERLRDSSETISYQSGCIVYDAPVSELVDRGEQKTVRLDSNEQTIKEWKSANKSRASFGYDIAGGGFPDSFVTGGGYVESLSDEYNDCLD